MLTLAQLYDLGVNEGIDIYAGLQLPVDSPLDRTTLINSIIMRCGLNYPNFADPNVMASAITIWSAKHQYTFEHVAKIYKASYSPIENYDRYEDMSTNRDRTMDDTTKNTSTKTEGITSNRTTTHSGTDTTTDTAETSAYDSSTYQPTDKTTSSLLHGESVTDGGNSTKTTTNNLTSDKDVKELEKTTQLNHIRGNIGVTTADAMQKEEYEFLANYNPYEFLSRLFENELTLFVY